jgi:hypothetical protein
VRDGREVSDSPAARRLAQNQPHSRRSRWKSSKGQPEGQQGSRGNTEVRKYRWDAQPWRHVAEVGLGGSQRAHRRHKLAVLATPARLR